MKKNRKTNKAVDPSIELVHLNEITGANLLPTSSPPTLPIGTKKPEKADKYNLNSSSTSAISQLAFLKNSTKRSLRDRSSLKKRSKISYFKLTSGRTIKKTSRFNVNKKKDQLKPLNPKKIY